MTERPFDDLLFVVPRRMHFRLELGRPDLAHRFEVHGADGEALPVVSFQDGGRDSATERPVREGRTRVYAVGEAAREVVLFAGETEVGRIPVRLRAGAVNIVRR